MKIKNSILLIFSILILLSTSCSLDKSNPLDPQGNPDMKIPPNIVGLSLASSNQQVKITWTHSTEVDKYYIYRSLTHDGDYERIKEINNTLNDNTMSTVDSDVVLSGLYFYKISGVKNRLEGHISNFMVVRVVQ